MQKVVYNPCFGGFSISEKAINWFAEKGIKIDRYLGLGDLGQEIMPRHHPLLVQCVEELGDEANGEYAEISIYKVDSLYIINEYDGYESICEPKDINWIDAKVV